MGKKHQTMKYRGKIESQINTGANNSAIEKCEKSQPVLEKLLKNVYFLARKISDVKQNFDDVTTFI